MQLVCVCVRVRLHLSKISYDSAITKDIPPRKNDYFHILREKNVYKHLLGLATQGNNL